MRLGLEGLFVGRRRELTLPDAQFDEVQAGHPRVVHMEGLAGIGKTALVERFLSQCSDAQLVRASGEESEVQLAYGVIDQLFHAAVPGAPPKARAVPLEDHLKVGAQLLDVLGSLWTPVQIRSRASFRVIARPFSRADGSTGDHRHTG
jgi:hypothetical protein